MTPPQNPKCRANHSAYPESTLPCSCPQRPDDYMRRSGLPVVPLEECYRLGIIPRPRLPRP